MHCVSSSTARLLPEPVVCQPYIRSVKALWVTGGIVHVKESFCKLHVLHKLFPVLIAGSGIFMQAYGKTAYLITTLKVVPRGTEGAVSLEGTAAGVVAAAFFAGLAFALKLVR